MKSLASLVDAIVKLLKVKSIITIGMVGALIYLAVNGTVEIAVFTAVCSSVLTYYFGKKDGSDDDEKPPKYKIDD